MESGKVTKQNYGEKGKILYVTDENEKDCFLISKIMMNLTIPLMNIVLQKFQWIKLNNGG